jgi:hypothetical protein
MTIDPERPLATGGSLLYSKRSSVDVAAMLAGHRTSFSAYHRNSNG